MLQSNLGDACGRFLSSRLSKQMDVSSSKNSLRNEQIANEQKRHTILNQKLLFKTYNKNPLEQLRQRYSTLLPRPTNDVILTTITNHSVVKPSSSKTKLMMNWELIKDRGSGLVNLGNTCFIMQCIIAMFS